jgi:hypothetical protein
MPVISIPFDYDPLRYGESLVPIFVNDTDEQGERICFGWIEAVVPVQEKLRALARRVLGDVWRVSELTELTVHHLWARHGNDLGLWPSHRVYATARWKAHGIDDPGARSHHRLNLALDSLNEYRRDALLGEAKVRIDPARNNLDLSEFEKKLRKYGTEDDFRAYLLLRAGYHWVEIGKEMDQNWNSVYRRFARVVKRISKIA